MTAPRRRRHRVSPSALRGSAPSYECPRPRERSRHRSEAPPTAAAGSGEDPRRLPRPGDPSAGAVVLGDARSRRRHADGAGGPLAGARGHHAVPQRPADAQHRARRDHGRVRALPRRADRPAPGGGRRGDQGRLLQARRDQADADRHAGDGRVGRHRQHPPQFREHLPRAAADAQPRHGAAARASRARDRRQPARALGGRRRVRRGAARRVGRGSGQADDPAHAQPERARRHRRDLRRSQRAPRQPARHPGELAAAGRRPAAGRARPGAEAGRP